MADKPGAPAAGEGKPEKAKEAPRPKERVRKSVLEKLQRMPRRKGEFSYRGYTLEQLQSMDLEALAEVLPSRVRRKLGRGLSPEERKFVEKVQGHGATGPASPSPGASRGDAPLLKTHLRRMVVLPAMVGKEIQVHNGKTFDKIAIVPEMIGHYLGELALTRKRVKHGAAGIGATRSSKFIPLK